jgi:hypothetical protein
MALRPSEFDCVAQQIVKDLFHAHVIGVERDVPTAVMSTVVRDFEGGHTGSNPVADGRLHRRLALPPTYFREPQVPNSRGHRSTSS